MYKIIGISGTFCSGKDAACEYIEKQYNYSHVSSSDLLREEARKRGLTITRTVLQDIGDEMRGLYGTGVIAETILNRYRNDTQHSGLVIAGIRNPGETDVIRNEGGIVLFVDAPPELRWKRMLGRSRDDQETTLEEFKRNEKREIKSDNPAAINFTTVKSKADKIIYNDGSLEQFHESVDAAIMKD